MTPNLTETPPTVDGERQTSAKISHEFSSRLAALPAHEWVRTVILPALPETETPLRGADRAAAIQAAHQATEAHFADVDQVLEQCGGHRVTARGNSLGFVVVEATPAAIHALCDLAWVRAVLEDQPIYPVG